MENLPINNGNGQSYGFILYETPICSGGDLYADVQDTAQVGGSSFSMEVNRTFSLTLLLGRVVSRWSTLLFDSIFKDLLCVR